MPIDLRSDTVTRPTDAMRAAMAAAEVGDDVYGEDPTVDALERRVAELLGHEAAVFTPTGTMANQLGIRTLVAPGQELLCDADAHVVRAELGAAAALAGITTRTWSTPDGRFDPDTVAGMSRPGAGPYFVSTAAVAIENTHNFGGGTVIPLESMQRLRELTRPTGVTIHLDGARLWNAHVASGVPLATYGQLADTVSVCLSKGLGAPVGSLLASSRDRVDAARIWRKRLGGGMRQVGILAAAGLHALDHHVERVWPTTTPGPAGWPTPSRPRSRTRSTRRPSRPTSWSSRPPTRRGRGPGARRGRAAQPPRPDAPALRDPPRHR